MTGVTLGILILALGASFLLIRRITRPLSALAEAADTLSASPASLQLRYLQTLVEVASEQNSTILPIPMDIIREFAGALRGNGGD